MTREELEADVERAWGEEIRRRLKEIRNGAVETIPVDVVLAELDDLVK